MLNFFVGHKNSVLIFTTIFTQMKYDIAYFHNFDSHYFYRQVEKYTVYNSHACSVDIKTGVRSQFCSLN